MDVNLESLIEKVKNEAVEEGQQAAAQITGKARAEADEILQKARAEAERIVTEARAEADKLLENSKQALRQAARDAELMLKERLSDLFDRVFQREIGRALTPEALAEMIQKLVTRWAEHGDIEVVVNEADKEALEGLLLAGLGEELKKGVTLRASHAVSKGFRFELKGSSVYYDFSDATITETLRAFISPSLQAILDGEDG